MNKVYKNAIEALFDITDGATLLLGGFGLCGIPENLIQALVDKKIKNLTCISNNAGVDGFGIGLLLSNKQLKKMIASYVGENKLFEQQAISGELDVDLVPQGTLSERIRAAGAGIGGFYTRTGVGTLIAEGKEKKTIDGVDYIFERPLPADYALIKAYKGDTDGNLVYRKTARNFNPVMATAGKITIVEVEQLVKVGELDPESIITPSIYVDRIFQGTNYQKRIEKRTTR